MGSYATGQHTGTSLITITFQDGTRTWGKNYFVTQDGRIAEQRKWSGGGYWYADPITPSTESLGVDRVSPSVASAIAEALR